MRHLRLMLLVFAASAAHVSAQGPTATTQNTPGSIAPAATQTTPLVVEVNIDDTTAVSGRNDAFIGGAGVTGAGYNVGVTGTAAIGPGGVFTSERSRAVEAVGWNGGVWANCGNTGCTAVYGEAPNHRYGTGVAGVGLTGIFGRGEAFPGMPAGVRPLAGQFVGDVDVSGATRVSGVLSAPIIDQLLTQIAALSARVAALEAGGGARGTVLPARIQAEDYDTGGQNVAYNDTTAGNIGGAYRTDDVDIKASAEGDYAVGWAMRGEWLAYTVRAPAAGTYRLRARVGSALAGRTFHFEVDGVAVAGGARAVPQLPDWDRYGTVDGGSVALTAGTHVIRFVIDGPDYLDFQWLEVTP